MNIGNFISLINFVILKMEENEEVLIILGSLFLNTARAVVDISDSH